MIGLAALAVMAHILLGTALAAPMGEEFPLRLGDSESVDEGSLSLTFVEVARDNRCPKDVQCIVAGEAVAIFAAETSDGASADLTFEVPPGGSATQSYEGYTITVVSVDPQTHSKRRIKPEDYVARVLVERS